MSDASPPNSTRPSWLTVGLISAFCTGLGSAATVGVKYGKQETALSSLTERNQEYREANKELLQNLKEWRQTYESQQAQLLSTQASLQRLQNDRCTPIRNRVDDLKIKLEVASSGVPSSNVGVLQDIMKDYQNSLRSCYGAKE